MQAAAQAKTYAVAAAGRTSGAQAAVSDVRAGGVGKAMPIKVCERKRALTNGQLHARAVVRTDGGLGGGRPISVCERSALGALACLAHRRARGVRWRC